MAKHNFRVEDIERFCRSYDATLEQKAPGHFHVITASGRKVNLWPSTRKFQEIPDGRVVNYRSLGELGDVIAPDNECIRDRTQSKDTQITAQPELFTAAIICLKKHYWTNVGQMPAGDQREIEAAIKALGSSV